MGYVTKRHGYARANADSTLAVNGVRRIVRSRLARGH